MSYGISCCAGSSGGTRGGGDEDSEASPQAAQIVVPAQGTVDPISVLTLSLGRRRERLRHAAVA